VVDVQVFAEPVLAPVGGVLPGAVRGTEHGLGFVDGDERVLGELTLCIFVCVCEEEGGWVRIEGDDLWLGVGMRGGREEEGAARIEGYTKHLYKHRASTDIHTHTHTHIAHTCCSASSASVKTICSPVASNVLLR
jgi:hypothetical protein